MDEHLCEAAGRVVEEAGRLYVAKDRPRVYVKLILITHSNGNILAVLVANNLVARRDHLWTARHHLRSNKLRKAGLCLRRDHIWLADVRLSCDHFRPAGLVIWPDHLRRDRSGRLASFPSRPSPVRRPLPPARTSSVGRPCPWPDGTSAPSTSFFS